MVEVTFVSLSSYGGTVESVLIPTFIGQYLEMKEWCDLNAPGWKANASSRPSYLSGILFETAEDATAFKLTFNG